MILLLCGMALWCGSAVAGDKVLDVTASGSPSVSLTEYFSVLEDPTGMLTLADVRQPAVSARFKGDLAPAPALNYGFTPSAYWLRLSLKNSADHPVDRLLEISFVRIGSIDFHQLNNDVVVQSVSTGFLAPFASRPYRNRLFVFPVTLSPHTDLVVLLRVQSKASLQVPAVLWEAQAFHDHEVNDYLGQEWYFGTAGAMVLFNLFLFIALRDRLYLLYVLSMLSFSLGILSESGLGNQYLGIATFPWAMASGLGMYSVSALFFLFFFRQMLDTATLAPRLDYAIKFLALAYAVVLVGLFISYPTFVKPFNFVMLLGLVVQVSVSVLGSWRRQRSAYYFLVAFSALIAAAGLNGLSSLGLVALAIPASNLIQLGSAIEMVLLAFALADRYHTLRQDKAKAQAQAIQAQAETLRAQAQTYLAQTEKMTALMQLVTNVAHEVNTPIGAVKASGKNIVEALEHALGALPQLLRYLDAPQRDLFNRLVNPVGERAALLNSREERAAKNDVRRQLEAAGVADADSKARVLVGLHAQSAPLDYLPLLQHAECDFILETASSIGSIVHSATNINLAVDRVAKIVTTLKSFSQADRVSTMREVDLQAGVETVLSIYSNDIKQGTELVRRYEPVPGFMGLPDELIEVWTHLVHNALQAMHYKGTLTIGLRCLGDDAVVSITDTGSGMSDEIRERIFEPFFTTRPPGEGAGLGLAIVKKIIDKHNGRVDVQTEVGVGTTFTVFLPLRAPGEETNP